jgi:hypothetical protein
VTMRFSVALLIVVTCLCSCGGVTVSESDATAPSDAGSEGCPFCFDGGSYDASPPPPPPPPPNLDAGTNDGAVVRCGHASDGGEITCVAPEEYCCVNATALADGSYEVQQACVLTNAPKSCNAALYCDDLADCITGVCCWRYDESPSLATCSSAASCDCGPYPNCYMRTMCDPGSVPDASTCPKCITSALPDYGTCL